MNAITPADVLARERAAVAITLAAKQVEAESFATPEQLATIVVTDATTYTEVTALRTEVRAELDSTVKLRQAAAQPWKKVATTIEEMFRPTVKALECIESNIKGKLEAYVIAKAKAEAEANARALKAAQADDSTALTTALTESAALAQRDEGGRVVLSWVVDRVAPDLLPDEWWTPDHAKIAAVAKAHKGDEPPVIPGVIFKRDASVAVRR